MPRSNCWEKYPLPPNWEKKYDSGTNLNAGDSLRRNDDEIFFECPCNFPSSTDSPERNASVELSCAPKTDSIVKKFLSEGYEVKQYQLQRRTKSSTSRRSRVRKARGRNVDSESSSPPPFSVAPPTHTCQPLHYASHCGMSANLESMKDCTVLREVVAGQEISKHGVGEHLIALPETGELRLALLHIGSASPQDTVKRTQSPKSSYPGAGGNSDPIFEALEPFPSGRSKKAAILSGLLIQTRGPNQSLLCRRTSAKGPDPSLHRGPNSLLVHGPNPALRENRL
ncbi:hypothetical protein TcWFU_005534 [Taenia crassiceps]|uniref:Uncharacterized protein n=1 Tax=Taenia crassiceps TaxID=6207 RepID=A0ABR4QR94_9CEST